jgi:hypothetical protein
MLQKIAIARNSVYVSSSVSTTDSKITKDLLLAGLSNWAGLGYSVSKELYNSLSDLCVQDFIEIYNEVFEELLEISGMRYTYKAFYPQFPNQKVEQSKLELLIQQLLHYWVGYEPTQEENEERVPYLGFKRHMKQLSVVSEQDINDIFALMLISKSSLTPSQVEELRWFIKTNPDSLISMLPETFGFQEVGALVISELIKVGKTTLESELVAKHLNSATMILRIIVGLNDGDISLVKKTKLIKFNNALKRSVVLAFAGLDTDSVDQDVLRHKNSWRLIFNLMHANAIRNVNPVFTSAVAVVRDNKKVLTFASQVQTNYLAGNYETVLELLTQRPTELLRKLDQLLRKGDPEQVLPAFAEVAHKCSSRALYQLIGFYRCRDEVSKRVFLPKGKVAKGHVIDNQLQSLPRHVKEIAIEIAELALVQKYKSKEKIEGKVFVDPILKNYTLPLSLRSASRALKTLGRGTRIEFDKDATFLRLFIHWLNIPGMESRCDIDLSAHFLSEDLKQLGKIYYGNYNTSDWLDDNCAIHSGDKTVAPAPNGASEFIDINIDKMLAKGVRYAVMSLHNFTDQKFSDFEVASAGWMVRDDMSKNSNLFEPTLVQERFDLNAESTYSIPVIFDLETREVFWLDMCVDSLDWIRNIETTKVDTLTLVEAMLSRKFPTLYDLFYAHALARADAVVNCREEATAVFDLSTDSIINFQNIELIMSEL